MLVIIFNIFMYLKCHIQSHNQCENDWNSLYLYKNAPRPPPKERYMYIYIYIWLDNDGGELMMMMNCFYGMVDRWKVPSLISSRDHCHRSLPPQIFDTPRTGFELPQNLNSSFAEWRCAVMITTAPRRHLKRYPPNLKRYPEFFLYFDTVFW